MVRCRQPDQTSPAASDARALCGSRSMVHMRMANSTATPDRGRGMGHLQAYRVAVDGKRLASNTGHAPQFLVFARRLIFAAATLLVASVASSTSYAQSGPFAGM